jgi:hypothetical protein
MPGVTMKPVMLQCGNGGLGDSASKGARSRVLPEFLAVAGCYAKDGGRM